MVDSATVHPFPDTQIFRDVFDASPIGIVVETLEGQPLFANPSFCSLLGFSEDELRNKHCVDFSPPEDAKKDWELFQQLKQGLIDHYQLDKRYFRRDGSLVWGRLSLSLLNSRTTPLVIAMVENITDIKRAEEALREGEERLRLAVQAGRMFAYSWDARTDLIERSGESRAILGLEEDTSTSQALSAMIHPEDREKVKAAITQLSGESPNLHIDYRMIRPDAKIIWVERNSRAYFDSSGNLSRVIGMVVDVTERKLAEVALAGMSRKLIESQEQERARIGRELHDDINQRVAALVMQLEELEEDPSDVQSRAGKLRIQAAQILHDVQALSQELHSSKLKYLGLVRGMKSWCREFAERQKMEIDFSGDLQSVPPFDLGLSLLRVLQEALHNAIKHSGVKRVEVRIQEHSGQVHLIVADKGKGFDVEEALHGPGLGLASMRERVRLANGTIDIDAKPFGGTKIHVRIPLPPEQIQRAAG